MNKVLNESVEQVKVLSAQARKGTIESLYLQIDMGKLIFQGYTYWKANKKELLNFRKVYLYHILKKRLRKNTCIHLYNIQSRLSTVTFNGSK